MFTIQYSYYSAIAGPAEPPEFMNSKPKSLDRELKQLNEFKPILYIQAAAVQDIE